MWQGADEFQKDYPVHRVFHPEELHHALRLADGDPGEASALLWSVKEAVVKALGCAFHLVDPRQVNVYPAVERQDGGYTFPVGLSGKALERFPIDCGPVSLGPFASSGEDLVFHRPGEPEPGSP